MVVRQQIVLAVAGVALAGALGVTRVIATLQFGVRPTDPAMIVGANVLRED
jgi:hypothetical protein